MKYATFPATGQEVSRLGFGAMGFAGWFGRSEDADWIRALHAALDAGVNFIDTARAYGRSEAVVGKGLAQWSGDRPFVATKIEQISGNNLPWGIPVAAEMCFPPGHMRADLETSLRTLGLDHVDLVQLHVWWPTWDPNGYWMDELQALKDGGLTASIGVSIPDHRSDMALPLVMSGRIDAVQTIVNVFDSTPFDNLVPIAERHGVAVIGRCTVDEGGLTGFLTDAMTFDDDDYRSRYFDETVPRSVYMGKIAALEAAFVPRAASSLAALAIKYAIHHPGVTTALVSMHVQEYAEMNIAAVDEAPLSDDDVHELYTTHRWIKNLNHCKHWDPPS